MVVLHWEWFVALYKGGVWIFRFIGSEVCGKGNALEFIKQSNVKLAFSSRIQSKDRVGFRKVVVDTSIGLLQDDKASNGMENSNWAINKCKKISDNEFTFVTVWFG